MLERAHGGERGYVSPAHLRVIQHTSPAVASDAFLQNCGGLAWRRADFIRTALCDARCFRKFISSLLVLFATVFVLLVFYGCSHYNKPAGKRRAINITEIIVVWFHLSFITSLASEL